MGTILELRNITKHYPGVTALDHVSMKFEQGKIHALVGENGAGKSTLIKDQNHQRSHPSQRRQDHL